MKAFWYRSKNVGDTLTPIIVEHFTGERVEFVERNIQGKILAVGSIMNALRNGDTVWGTGIMRESDSFRKMNNVNFLAVRGKLTEKILGENIGVYGDPALLLPLMYDPDIKSEGYTGIIPHYIDKPLVKIVGKSKLLIDIESDWKEFVDQIKRCDRVVSSSLHGIIIAEAYGIPARWVKYSENVIGGNFKFHDYLTGTNRPIQNTGDLPPIPNLKQIQDKLLLALKSI